MLNYKKKAWQKLKQPVPPIKQPLVNASVEQQKNHLINIVQDQKHIEVKDTDIYNYDNIRIIP